MEFMIQLKLNTNDECTNFLYQSEMALVSKSKNFVAIYWALIYISFVCFFSVLTKLKVLQHESVIM